jgi:hypothetical protein
MNKCFIKLKLKKLSPQTFQRTGSKLLNKIAANKDQPQPINNNQQKQPQTRQQSNYKRQRTQKSWEETTRTIVFEQQHPKTINPLAYAADSKSQQVEESCESTLVNIELKVSISHLYSLEALKTLQYAADFHEATHYATSTSDRPKLQDRAYKLTQRSSKK